MDTMVAENTAFNFNFDIENINPEIINAIITTHKNIVTNRFMIFDSYYKGKQAILNRQIEGKNKPNNKPVTNICSYVSDVLTGFFMGKTPTYVSDDKQYLSDLLSVFKANDETNCDISLASKSSIKGTAFEIVYIDENNNICFDPLDTDGTIVVYDTTIKKNPLLAIRYYQVQDVLNSDNNIDKVEVYTSDKIYYYTQQGDSLKLDNAINHYFGEVPIIEYPNNRYRRNDFESIITLNDSYNKNNADIANDIEYYSNCYFALKGVDATEDEDIENIKQDRTVILPENGDAKFITKDINDTVVQNFRNNLNEDMHKISYVPDLSKEFPSNLSGTAIKQKFFTTEQAIVKKELEFKKALQKRIRLITTALNFMKNTQYDYREITINFNRNIPISQAELADAALKYNGVLPTEILYSELNKAGLEFDINRALQLKDEENNKSLDLDKVPSSFNTKDEDINNEQQDR